MLTRLRSFLENLRNGFWLVPGGLVLGAVALAFASIGLDRRHADALVELAPWLSEASPQGTRALVGTAATAVLTLAGVTFSATLVALTMASAQFGPRLVRQFVRSRGSQVVLGGLLATFAYSLLVLRATRAVEEGAFVPHASAFLVFLATLASVGLFVFFIHHLATSIQAGRVVARAHAEAVEAIEAFFPEQRRPEEERRERAESRRAEREGWEPLAGERLLEAEADGYLLAIDGEGLLAAVSELDARCRVLCHPGEFVPEGHVIASLDGSDEELDEHRERLLACFLFGPTRTSRQDLEMGIRQLVEVGLRALSPGINDPFTAGNCIDYLGAALGRIAGRLMPGTVLCADDDQPRVLLRPISFAGLLAAAFAQLRQAAADRPDVLMRICDALGKLTRRLQDGEQVEAVAAQAAALRQGAELMDARLAVVDRDALGERLDRLEELLEERRAFLADGPWTGSDGS